METSTSVSSVSASRCRGTANQTGFEMAASTPLLEHWVSAYRNDHRGRPLLDIGCAYGRNVLAAAQRLEGSRSDGTEVQIVACDCAKEHLAVVDELEISGVKTAWGKLPEDLEAAVASDVGGFSGILLSEVLHQLPGSSIEKTLMAMIDLLAPGGTLCITMFSPNANFSGGACPVGKHMRHVFEERRGEGKRWPGEGFRLKELLEELKAPVHLDAEAMKCFCAYHHCATAEQLRRAAEEAGFQVLLAQQARHPGHAEAFWGEGGESTQLVAVKPKPSEMEI